MATTFFLVRHAAHGLLDRVLTGRMPRVHLGADGRRQAELLARHFAGLGITGVQTSPRERAAETARPIAEAAEVGCEVVEALDEIDIGEWTGRSFVELDADPRWQHWNMSRSVARCPGGETMGEAQARIVGHICLASAAEPDGRFVLVSHADVVKAALLHFLGRPIAGYSGMEISPAGISTVMVEGGRGRVVGINERVAA